MKLRILMLIPAATLLAACGSTEGEKQVSSLDSFEQKYSYALGQDIGNSLSNLPMDVEMDYLVQGLRDAGGEGDTLLSDEEARQVLQEFTQKAQAAQLEQRQSQAADNLANGEQYRQDNAAREGVTTTESGLQIETLQAGEGPQPTVEDRVSVHYTGTLVDGTKFDSSVDRGQPATFPLNGVIKGWTEGLQLMNVGGKYRLVIPPELGYGASGAGQKIGPNATLVFDIELLSIEGQDEGADSAEEDAAEGEGSEASEEDAAE